MADDETARPTRRRNGSWKISPRHTGGGHARMRSYLGIVPGSRADKLEPRVREVFDAWLRWDRAPDSEGRRLAHRAYNDLLVRLSDRERKAFSFATEQYVGFTDR